MARLWKQKAERRIAALVVVALAASLFAACSRVETPTPEPYLSATAPPQQQELRWSNGRLPRSLDPVRATAAPESDIVCALYEGLTEIDPATLNAVPAAAEKWSAADGGKVWTFHLRRDAKWSNGKRVVASDFVTSWKRAGTQEPASIHAGLFENIIGLAAKTPPADRAMPQPQKPQPEQKTAGPLTPASDNETEESPAPRAEILGVVALDDARLQVSLKKADNDFPRLVSDPAFRPVYGDGGNFAAKPLDPTIVTNGPFTVAEINDAGIALARSDTYWNKTSVKLDRIRFVPTENAEAALAAYKNGELDAITNSDFEPLALKLLAPYGDLRQTTHNALNLYEFNTRNAPFSDRRVREALSTAIDRQRIVDAEFQGTAEAADDFLPMSKGDGSLDHDAAYARDLLTRAGYPNGENFPAIRLVVNRNDVQQRVARLVARMWKQDLGVETQIIIKEPAEMDAVRASGEYDLIRRGIVFPTADEAATLAAIFHPAEPLTDANGVLTGFDANTQLGSRPGAEPHGPSAIEKPVEPGPSTLAAPAVTVTSASEALYELYSIPLYSPNAYSLVKPYVHGLQITGLNSVSVRNISIDNTWSPPKAAAQ
ncbi:MAG TPA: peptide ABC transporter substrate-binding protein [Pyrinomonadaceae bacterium]|nr:peptide ABC transporter substrate-binding protein [Pyrinomonadaceae bacterium]